MKDLANLYYFEKLLEDVNNDLVRQAQAKGNIAIGAVGNEFVKMIFVSFLNSNIYPLKNLPTSRVCIFLETPYSKASSHFPIASHLQ